MATICNMGAEIGATTSIFPFNERMSRYLVSTNRSDIAKSCEQYAAMLDADQGAEYDQLIEIDLDTLEPHVNGPFTPDLGNPISKLGATAVEKGWPTEVKVNKYSCDSTLPP